MTSLVALLLLAPQTKAQQVFIPAAKTSMVFLDNMSPVLMSQEDMKQEKETTGCAASYKWAGSTPHVLTTLSYYTYTSAPRKTNRELAEDMFAASKEAAERFVQMTGSNDILEAFKQKFVDRTVTETKVGGYPAWLDSHEDKLADSWRRYLAWGDSKEQWCLELIGSNEIPAVKDILKMIVESVAAVKFDDAKTLADLALKPQKLPGLMCSINAPGVFQVYPRVPLDASRPGGQGFGANMPMGPISAVIFASKYSDSVVSSTLKTAEGLQKNTVTPAMTVRGSKVRPVTVGGVSGHEFALDFDDAGVPSYYCGVALAQEGREWIVHVQASKAAGGEKKVRSILETFKPE
ncbi:MAG: hypothetical protein KF824_01780 [Fimbriimonadaceae bacterium]|nr:MAG: hypothetical protein KF824_01780 [Fimbriimonadaceae bacterium]